MADKGSFPEGFAIPLLPKLRKRKLSRSTLCIICQTDRPGEPVRKTKEDSIEKAIKATEQRRDEEAGARFVSHDADTGIQLVMHHTQVTKIFAIKRIAMLYSIQAGKRKSTSSLVGLFIQQWPQLIGRGVSFVKIRLIKRVEILSIYAHSWPVKASE